MTYNRLCWAIEVIIGKTYCCAEGNLNVMSHQLQIERHILPALACFIFPAYSSIIKL